MVVALWLLNACRTQRELPIIASQELTTRPIVADTAAYVLKVGDQLQIRNLNWSSALFPDPSQLKVGVGASTEGFIALVSSDGHISLPEIGRLNVVGLTRQRLTDTLSVLYSNVIRDPLFEVSIMNLRIKVLGAVNTQGVFPLESESQSLGETLAKAGGIRYSDASDRLQIIRSDGQKQIVIDYDFRDLGNPNIMNQRVYDNDIVYIAPTKETIRTLKLQRNLILVQPILIAMNLTILIINLVR
ncbi:hypothetical protein GCM10027275_30270 [Rhabdobacter roseus]